MSSALKPLPGHKRYQIVLVGVDGFRLEKQFYAVSVMHIAEIATGLIEKFGGTLLCEARSIECLEHLP